jgi:hypothetical protein
MKEEEDDDDDDDAELETKQIEPTRRKKSIHYYN